MDVESGLLITDEMYQALTGSVRQQFQPVPGELQADAEEELDGKSETYVDLDARAPLANWARSKQRCKRVSSFAEAKKKRQMASASRRGNRR